MVINTPKMTTSAMSKGLCSARGMATPDRTVFQFKAMAGERPWSPQCPWSAKSQARFGNFVRQEPFAAFTPVVLTAVRCKHPRALLSISGPMKKVSGKTFPQLQVTFSTQRPILYLPRYFYQGAFQNPTILQTTCHIPAKKSALTLRRAGS